MTTSTTCVLIAVTLLPFQVPLRADETLRFDFVQHGKMHEVVGKQQHQGRVTFKDIVKRPHFYGVAALESLAGEATIFDGEVTITTVSADGKLIAKDTNSMPKAALLVGAYVPAWTDTPVGVDIASDEFGDFVEKAATRAGIDTSDPIPFVVEGEFRDVRLHVIHGACPIRARMRKETLSSDRRPYETEFVNVTGKLVGVFARDSVGDITHPATATHMHLLYQDDAADKMRTGHVEKVTVMKGAVLQLPR